MVPGTILSLEDIKRSFAPVLKAGGAKRAILFGSYARGEADEYSDIDLVVIADTNKPFFDRFTDFMPLYDPFRKGLDLLIYTPEEFQQMVEGGNPFICHLLEEGVVIYETRP